MKLLVDLIKRIQPAPQTRSVTWEDYFHGHEVLLWSSAPQPKMNWTWTMVGLSLFGIPFLLAGLGIIAGGVLQMTGAAHEVTIGLFMILFGLPFLGVGVGLTMGIWVAVWLSPHFIRYALSTKRAYIAKSWWNHTMESYPIGAHSYIKRQQSKTDTVFFAKFTERDSDGDRNTSHIGFENIADGAAVYKLLREIQQKATQ